MYVIEYERYFIGWFSFWGLLGEILAKTHHWVTSEAIKQYQVDVIWNLTKQVYREDFWG